MKLFKRRPGLVYGAQVVHERNGRLVRHGYIGKTRQRLAARVEQHRATQPWSDLVVRWYVIKAGMFSDLGLWWAEVWRILLFLPIYNYQWNRLNPRRIPIWVAAERHRTPACRAALRVHQSAYTFEAGRAYRIEAIRAAGVAPDPWERPPVGRSRHVA